MTYAEIHVRSHQCIATLQSRAQAVAQEHRERIKQLRAVAQAIEQKGSAGQLTLGDQSPSFSPEIDRLLADPTHGL